MEVIEDLENSFIIVVSKEDLKEIIEGCYRHIRLRSGARIEMRRVV